MLNDIVLMLWFCLLTASNDQQEPAPVSTFPKIYSCTQCIC